MPLAVVAWASIPRCRMRPLLTGRSQKDSYPDALLLFRCEFRPLECTQLLFSPVSPPYRGNTTSFDGVLALAWLFFVLWCFLVLLLWRCWFLVGFWGFTSSSCCVSYPSMMTWAYRPHGVRTRGKRIKSGHTSLARMRSSKPFLWLALNVV